MQTRVSPNQKHRGASAPHKKTVTIGSTVTIRDLESGERDVYTLVHPPNADISLGRISSLTPAGGALYGRCAGDTVEINAPGGMVHVLIESVEVQPDE